MRHDAKNIEELFLQMKRSLPCLTKIRFIDNKGEEVVRVDGTPIALLKEKAVSRITAKEELQNRFSSAYFQTFNKLKKGEIGYSSMDLNKENGKITKPKQPTLRMGMALYDQKGVKRGMVVINICLRTFFLILQKTTLYHIHLIDKEGYFLTHHNEKYGLFGDMKYNVKDEFPNDYRRILENNEAYGKIFYSKKLNFDNGQEIKIILESKFSNESDQTGSLQEMFLYAVVILFVLSFPLIFYFSKLPDKLEKQALEEKFMDIPTGLPNKLSLIQGLMDRKYKDCVIILLSINNIVKIQNSYGYQISSELLMKLSKFVQTYQDSHIENIYLNSVNTFAFKYRYRDDESLHNFLEILHKRIENKSFEIADTGLEFSVHATVGCSDPYNLNNSMEELQEAENALAIALETNKKIVIYRSAYFSNIEKNKGYLQLSRDIKSAIENEKILLHYQPIFNNMSREIEKYECLIRMEVEGKIVYPDTFLPIAKEVNLYEKLSFIVVEKACAFFENKAYEFSINLSVLDVMNEEFQTTLFETVIKDKIVLEIVESEGINNYEEFYIFVKKAKSMGLKIAIDDFGSGYSNFDYIIKLNEYIDYLKINGSLISTITDDDNAQILVNCIKYMSDSLSIKTIVEYVENEEILDYLTSIGIDYSQGYFIGKPKGELL